jgi:hypothetical protein
MQQRPPALTPAKERKVRKLLSEKVGVVKTGKGIGTGTVQRIKAEFAARR